MVLANPLPTVFCSLVEHYRVFAEETLNRGTWFLNDGPIDAVVVDVVSLGVSTFFSLKQNYPTIPILIYARNDLIERNTAGLGASAVFPPSVTAIEIQHTLDDILCQREGVIHGG